VVIFVVNAGYVEMALNFVCSMRMVATSHKDRFIAIATDRTSYGILRGIGVPTLPFLSGGTSHFPFDSVLPTTYQVWCTVLGTPGAWRMAHGGACHLVHCLTHAVALLQRFGSYDLQRLVHTRLQVALWLLRLGYNVLVCDADVVWMRDPFALLASYSNAKYQQVCCRSRCCIVGMCR
jgi:hypothetical protein